MTAAILKFLFTLHLLLPSSMVPQNSVFLGANYTASGGGAKSLAHSCGNSNGGTGVTSLACTLTVGSGDMIVVGWGYQHSSNTATIGDSASQSYVTDGSKADTGPTNIVAMGHKCNSTSGSITVTVTYGGTYNYGMIAIGDVPGASASCTDATFNGTNGASSGNPLTLGTITTTVNGDFIFGCGGQNSSPGAFTAGSGYTVPAAWTNANNAIVCEYQIQSTAGSTSPTFTNGSTTFDYQAGAMGYK